MITESQNINIVIAGYPKSGTMWTTRLVAQVLECPVNGYWGVNENTTVMEGDSRVSHCTCYLSHHLYEELISSRHPDIHKIIYLVRDPRDIVISGAYHFNFYHQPVSRLKHGITDPGIFLRCLKFISRTTYRRKQKIQRMIGMLKNGDPYINQCQYPWDHHINSYMDQDVLFVRYEDLLRDGFTEVSRILSFIGTSKNEDEIRYAIKKQSFESRKSEFVEKGDKVRVKHLRKGMAGDWKNYLSEKENRDLCDYFIDLMKKLDYEM